MVGPRGTKWPNITRALAPREFFFPRLLATSFAFIVLLFGLWLPQYFEKGSQNCVLLTFYGEWSITRCHFGIHRFN